MRRRHLLPLAGVLILSGCQTGTDALLESTVEPSLSGPAASAIAGDMAGRYAEQAQSTSMPIKLRRDNSEFAGSLEAALKGWGFSVLTGETAESSKDRLKPVELGWSLIAVDGQVLAQLSTASLAIGRAYTVSASGAAPASPLSLTKSN